MGGRGAKTTINKKSTRQILGQYELGNIRANTEKVVSFYRYLDNTHGVKIKDNKISVKREAHAELKSIVDGMVGNVKQLDNAFADEYKGIKDTLKRHSYSLSKQDRSNIPDFNQYIRKGNHVKISNKSGNTVDSLYKELAGKYPHLFNESKYSNPADQLQHINDTLNQIKPRKKSLDRYTTNEMSNEITNRILRQYVFDKWKAV